MINQRQNHMNFISKLAPTLKGIVGREIVLFQIALAKAFTIHT
jgi:hypothetical protein